MEVGRFNCRCLHFNPSIPVTKRRLSQDERIEIQSLVREDAPHDQIAEQFGISESYVYELGRKGRKIQESADEVTLPVDVQIEYKGAGHLVVHTASRNAIRAMFIIGADAFTSVARALRSTRTITREAFNERALQETCSRCVRLVQRWQAAQQVEIEVRVVTVSPTKNELISPSWVLFLLLRDAFSGSRVRVTRQTSAQAEDATALIAKHPYLIATLDELTNIDGD